jgi:hypothetical protein
LLGRPYTALIIDGRATPVKGRPSEWRICDQTLGDLFFAKQLFFDSIIEPVASEKLTSPWPAIDIAAKFLFQLRHGLFMPCNHLEQAS